MTVPPLKSARFPADKSGVAFVQTGGYALAKTAEHLRLVIHEDASRLREVALFRGLTDEEYAKVQAICASTWATGGTVLFEEGSFGDKCYVIASGEVRVSKMVPNGGEEALAVLKAGDYFGEMALIDDFPRSAHAIANTDVELLTISKSALDELLFFDKEIARKILWTLTRTLSARLRETNDKMAALLAMGARF